MCSPLNSFSNFIALSKTSNIILDMYEEIMHIKVFQGPVGYLAYGHLRNIYSTLSTLHLITCILDVQLFELLNSFTTDFSTFYQEA